MLVSIADNGDSSANYNGVNTSHSSIYHAYLICSYAFRIPNSRCATESHVETQDRMLEDSKKRFQLGLIYLFAVLATFGVAPFVVMRYLNGEYLKAILDLIIVVIAGANAWYAYRTQSVFYPSILAATQYSIATVAVIYLNGPLYFFWMFPAFSANFFLLRAPFAITVNVLIMLAMIPIAIQVDDQVAAFGMLASLLFAGSMTFVFSREANKHHQLLQTYATQDALTQLGNRRSMDLEMTRCIDDFKRSGIPATVIVLDLDHFKEVNDNFGHQCGDGLLVDIANLLRQRARKTDRLFRFGGEEFVILARNTHQESAKVVAEDFRTQIAAHIKSPAGAITTSLGCAELRSGETAIQWFERADQAMYQAKEEGRNRVILADEPIPSAAS